MPTPYIPPEIISHILGAVTDDKTLGICYALSRDWSDLAREHRFRTVTRSLSAIAPESELRHTHDFIAAHPHAARRVRDLRFRPEHAPPDSGPMNGESLEEWDARVQAARAAQPPATSLDPLCRALSMLPQLRTLTLFHLPKALYSLTPEAKIATGIGRVHVPELLITANMVPIVEPGAIPDFAALLNMTDSIGRLFISHDTEMPDPPHDNPAAEDVFRPLSRDLTSFKSASDVQGPQVQALRLHYFWPGLLPQLLARCPCLRHIRALELGLAFWINRAQEATLLLRDVAANLAHLRIMLGNNPRQTTDLSVCRQLETCAVVARLKTTTMGCHDLRARDPSPLRVAIALLASLANGPRGAVAVRNIYLTLFVPEPFDEDAVCAETEKDFRLLRGAVDALDRVSLQRVVFFCPPVLHPVIRTTLSSAIANGVLVLNDDNVLR